MNIWQETAPVRFGLIDRSDRLTLNAIFSFFQEAAISHASVLGVGRNAMTQAGQAWILSRFSVFVEKRPNYKETITVRSWPRGPEKLFALRDYDMIDSAGNTVVRARGAWLVIDMEKRRPIRVEPVIENLPPNDGLNALDVTPAGLPVWDNLVLSAERQAAYSDIDAYGHVNNVRYIQWIQDITRPELLENAAQMRLDINYLNEVKAGEKINLYAVAIEGINAADHPKEPTAGFSYEGRRSDKIVFRAELRLGA